MNTSGLPVYQIEDLLQQPELLAPPAALVPRLAWEGRVTLLSSPEKCGKSTLVGQAAAALATGETFLGEPVERQPVLWLALDEPLGDLVRRLALHGARHGVAVLAERPTPDQLATIVDEQAARLVVVDTLTEYMAGTVEDSYNAHHWQAPLAALRGIAQDARAAVVLLHHTVKSQDTKAGRRYAGSYQIGAGVDVVLEMAESPDDPTVRSFMHRGRVEGRGFRARYVQGRYELEQDAAPLGVQLYRAILAEPGISKTKLRSRVAGGTRAKDSELADLMVYGAIEVQPKGGYVANQVGFQVYTAKMASQGRVRVESGSPVTPLSRGSQRGVRVESGQKSAPPDSPPIEGGESQGQGWELGDAYEPEDLVA